MASLTLLRLWAGELWHLASATGQYCLAGVGGTTRHFLAAVGRARLRTAAGEQRQTAVAAHCSSEQLLLFAFALLLLPSAAEMLIPPGTLSSKLALFPLADFHLKLGLPAGLPKPNWYNKSAQGCT